MAARESEIEMTLEILDEVAFLFVEQFDNLYGMLVDRTDVKRIRKSADDGEDIPAIISYDLRKSYSPGEACSLRAEGTNAGYALDLNLRVVGVLYEYGGLMNLAVWQYVTNPNLITLIKRTPQDSVW